MTHRSQTTTNLLLILLILGSFMEGVPASALQACPGFDPLLTIGEQGQVVLGSPNNVRDQPTTGGTRIGQIPGGGIFMVLDGPRCNDGYTWWQVNYNGLIGWTAAGNSSGYYIELVTSGVTPVPPPNDDPSIDDALLEGLAFSGTGASPFYVCLNVGTVPSAYTSYNGSAISNGSTFIVNEYSWYAHQSMPALCAPQARSRRATGGAPDGSIVRLSLFQASNVYQYQLPLSAYTHPGLYRLSYGSFNIYLDVRPPTQPSFMVNMSSQLFVGGLKPNERFVLLSGLKRFSLNRANSSGYFFADLNAMRWQGEGNSAPSAENIILSASLIGQDGSTTPLKSAFWVGGNRYYIPPDFSASVVYAQIWLGQTNAADVWTCPNGLSIRLSQMKGARVLDSAGQQPIHGFPPSLRSTVLGTVPAGAFVTVKSGVECDGDATLWLVDYRDVEGWMAESSGGQYLLAPT